MLSFRPGKRGPNGGREIRYGMYAAGSHSIVSTEQCFIENTQAADIIRAIVPLMKRYKISPYDENRHTGFMRYAIVRVAHESGEILLTLVTNGSEFPASRSFCRDLLKKCPNITTIVQNINTAQSNVILGQKEKRLYGPGFILDTLCGLSFRISSQSFYQVNATQTACLYKTAIELACLNGTETVLDAYCGTGTIGLVAAKAGAKQVLAFDVVASAIEDARLNARHNGIDNAQFFTADEKSFISQLSYDISSIDLVFLDPPRAGCSQDFLDFLLQIQAPRIVYISCNPKTQARDVAYLQKGRIKSNSFSERSLLKNDSDVNYYRISRVQPIDMFPHTKHIENIVVLKRAKQ